MRKSQKFDGKNNNIDIFENPSWIMEKSNYRNRNKSTKLDEKKQNKETKRKMKEKASKNVACVQPLKKKISDKHQKINKRHSKQSRRALKFFSGDLQNANRLESNFCDGLTNGSTG